MYFGHFAVGMAIKAKYQDVPLLPIILGAGFLDVINGILVAIGIEKVTPNLLALPYLYFDLTFIDWDHSLLMAIVWSFVWGAFFLKDKRIAAVAALSCFLHFVADIPMHNADLALYPYAEQYLGFGLWGKWGIWSWIFEIIFSAILLAYAYRQHLQAHENIKWQLGFIGLLALQMSPWTSPMKQVAMLSEPYASIFHGILVTVGFIVPTIILAWLYKRSARLRKCN
ncbi:hypothetical protein B9T29_10915 [Acinetobacter sp. ANC 3903]|uniref:hypothetical protein n=1 Tax=Acinetobacter sp. ANC 3903 TaxID=1977883 RepID=UPI000A35A37A|nr:hypothetical protein [Acinetobacter sp. ANC 3903]OTG61661.1 hypothetical protein B9T29_10915 [Acinetobacter sp. ANC 3903]